MQGSTDSLITVSKITGIPAIKAEDLLAVGSGQVGDGAAWKVGTYVP